MERRGQSADEANVSEDLLSPNYLQRRLGRETVSTCPRLRVGRTNSRVQGAPHTYPRAHVTQLGPGGSGGVGTSLARPSELPAREVILGFPGVVAPVPVATGRERRTGRPSPRHVVSPWDLVTPLGCFSFSKGNNMFSQSTARPYEIAPQLTKHV